MLQSISKSPQRYAVYWRDGIDVTYSIKNWKYVVITNTIVATWIIEMDAAIEIEYLQWTSIFLSETTIDRRAFQSIVLGYCMSINFFSHQI